MKKLTSIFLSILFICSAFAFSACTGNNNRSDSSHPTIAASLKELPDEYVADYMSVFKLPTMLSDGTVINYTVKDVDGNIVELSNNSFVTEKFSNYTAKVVAGNDSKTITIKIQDLSAPEILAYEQKLQYKLINTVIVLEKPSAVDNFDSEVSVLYKLYKDDYEIEIEDDSFTPKELGDYRYVVTAIDTAGNVAERTVIYSVVATEAETYKVWAFDIADDYLDNLTYMVSEYSTDFRYEGQMGTTRVTLNVTAKNVNPLIAFKHTLIDTSEFTSIYFYVYNDSDYECTLCPNIANNSKLVPHQWSKVNITNFKTNNYSPWTSAADRAGMVAMFYSDGNAYVNQTVNLYFSAAYGVK